MHYDISLEKKINTHILFLSNMEAFEANVKAYVEKHNPTLYILTPCYGSVCYVNYVLCLIRTLNLCKKYNIDVYTEFCRNDSLVPRARNNLIARAMTDPKTTHMIFIDADIIWEPVDVIKLIISNQYVVGGVYPLKHFHFDRLSDPSIITKWRDARAKQPILTGITDENIIQHQLLRYNYNPVPSENGTIQVVNNLVEVRHLATGFMMIRRETIECMEKAFPSTKYVDDIGFLKKEEEEHAYALFDCAVENKHYYSEDWLFSQRWKNMGGKIYVNLTINLVHTGIQDFKGCFLASLTGGA